MEKSKIASFTGLRFIMIMVIVVSHFEFLGTFGSFGLFYTRFLHNATFAVDFFFLLSGFGMMLGNLTRTDGQNLRFPKISESLSYGIGHVKKIYPVYLATILFGLCAHSAYAVYKSKFSFSFVCKMAIKMLINIPLLQSATGMSIFTHAFNGVTWFLSALFCIYLISPILMFCLRKISSSYLTDFLLLLIDLAAIIILDILFGKIEMKFQNINGIENLSVNNLVYGSPYRRVFYVLTGMSLSMIFWRFKNEGKNLSEKLCNMLEIVISFFAILYFFTRNSLPNSHFHYKYITDTVLCSLFILIFAFDGGCISHFLKKEKMQHLGNMAMYIFLIHYPIRIYFSWFVEKIWGWTFFSASLFIVFVLISTFYISYTLYKKRR